MQRNVVERNFTTESQQRATIYKRQEMFTNIMLPTSNIIFIIIITDITMTTRLLLAKMVTTKAGFNKNRITKKKTHQKLLRLFDDVNILYHTEYFP